MTWLSPAFPVGAFGYSHGLEWAVEAGWSRDARRLPRPGSADLLRARRRLERRGAASPCLARGDGGDSARWLRVAELAEALRQPAASAASETTAQGEAFRRIAGRSAWPRRWRCSTAIDDADLAYPVAVGVLRRGHAASRSTPR